MRLGLLIAVMLGATSGGALPEAPYPDPEPDPEPPREPEPEPSEEEKRERARKFKEWVEGRAERERQRLERDRELARLADERRRAAFIAAHPKDAARMSAAEAKRVRRAERNRRNAERSRQ